MSQVQLLKLKRNIITADNYFDNLTIFMFVMITLGKPIMMFRVNLINYLVKLHLKCINEYCIRISEILCILKCIVMIDMKTRHILFW